MSTEQEILAAQDAAIEEFAAVVRVRIAQRIASVVGQVVADADNVKVYSDVVNGAEAHTIRLMGRRTDGEIGEIDSFQVVIHRRTRR